MLVVTVKKQRQDFSSYLLFASKKSRYDLKGFDWKKYFNPGIREDIILELWFYNCDQNNSYKITMNGY